MEISVCACMYRQIMNREEITKLVSALRNAGHAVTVIPDLCKTTISDSEQMAAIASTTVVACYPRAVRSLFNSLGLKPEQVFDIRNHSCEQILGEMGVLIPDFTALDDICNSSLIGEIYNATSSPANEQEAWNPVIDKERCTECAKCHDFCLFGVYSVDHGTVKVKQPQNCKNNCPACARVCPSNAIIFPKYEKSPVNGGLHNEEKLDETDTKVIYNIALKYKLEERRAKVSLFK
ncbi:MAG: ferredoxin family protein [Tannerella sp.]|nr:ferredoxin family protein [Tannerella sp.]